MRKIFAVILIPLMILSSGGFNVFTHYCHTSGKLIVSFLAPEKCRMDMLKHHHECGSCCSKKPVAGKCCESNHIFVRTVDNGSAGYLSPKIHLFSQKFVPEEKFFAEYIPQYLPNEYFYCDYSSPPGHTAKYIVVKYGNLKLDCCII
jgi:hypothetical protein